MGRAGKQKYYKVKFESICLHISRNGIKGREIPDGLDNSLLITHLEKTYTKNLEINQSAINNKKQKSIYYLNIESAVTKRNKKGAVSGSLVESDSGVGDGGCASGSEQV